ncbi:MAG TPA: DUF6496 domain-containing protein [Segetibacter sp.]|jgi:hypothetical protein
MAKYSKGAGKKVEEVMHEMKKGKLKSGSGKKVTNPKQAIAIALSEAREEGEKVPKKSAGKKAATKKAATKKAGTKKVAPKKVSGKKAATKKAAGKKASTKK